MQMESLYKESSVFLEAVMLLRKTYREEQFLERLGEVSRESYYDFRDRIDEMYSITERRYIAFHARDEQYVDDNVPPICQHDPLLMMFFVGERIIAGYGSVF
jgi:hypothetical protein